MRELVPDIVLKNPAELAARLALNLVDRVLLVDSPPSLEVILRHGREPGQFLESIAAKAIRSVKDRFEGILVWREDRVGSQALFRMIIDRLEPPSLLWAVIAMKKVTGPTTPAAHRLEFSDLQRAFEPEGLVFDRQVRVSKWHAGYRFSPGARAGSASG